MSAVSSFFCADCSLSERSFAVVRCLAIAALVWRSEQSLLTRLWLPKFFCPGAAALTDILDSANLPPFLDASTATVAVRALARVSAQLSTSARGGGHLARCGSVPRGRASSDGWAASDLKLRARGHPGGPWRALTRDCAVSTRSWRRATKLYPSSKRRFCHERVLERALTWVERAFGRPPQT